MAEKFFLPPSPSVAFDYEGESSPSGEEADEETITNEDGMEQTIEESDDSAEDESEGSKKRRMSRAAAGQRSKKHAAVASFFDTEAGGSDDDDEVSDDRNAVDEGQTMSEEALELMRQQDRRREAAGRFAESERSATAAAASIARPATQQSLIPSVSDPSLWMVSCPSGKEQQLVFQIMNKCTAQARQGRPIGISAVIAGQSKGKIYVESFDERAVKEAILGVRGLSQNKMRVVPLGNMTTVMTVAPKKIPLKKDDWVRMTRGPYKGDLALVKAVSVSGLTCVVQCIPRLDHSLPHLSPEEEARIHRKVVHPPQKLFNPQKLGLPIRRQKFPGLGIQCDYYDNNYFKDGFLLKEMNVQTMVKLCTEDDSPTLEEVQAFQRDLPESRGNVAAGRIESPNSGGLLIGDTVEVVEGDLVGMQGKIVSLDRTTVKIKPVNDARDTIGTINVIKLVANQVRKYIPLNTHVKVSEGRYANETGTVVAFERLEAIVLTDATSEQISVSLSHLHESVEVSSGRDTLQGYELYDLVGISGGGSVDDVGIIVRVGLEDFTVITKHGLSREVRPEALRAKRNIASSRAVALDARGSQIRVGTSVIVEEGQHKGQTGTVKRISLSQLFLHSQTCFENAGIFVARSLSCMVDGSKSRNRGAGMGGRGGRFVPRFQSQRGRAGGRRRNEDGLLGKTVRIRAGQWKGYSGTVTESNAVDAEVELHSRSKKIKVKRENAIVVGDKFGLNEKPNQNGIDGAVAPPTDAVGFPTPAFSPFGGATPRYSHAELTDEVWRPGGPVDKLTEEVWRPGGPVDE